MSVDLTPFKLAEIAVFRGAGQKITELEGLIEFLRPSQSSTIVEIGTDKGGTFWLWCQLAADDALIVSIDMPGGDFGVGYTTEDVKRFRTWARASQKLHFLMEDSHADTTYAKLTELLNGRKIDILFLDGDHTYEGMHEDFRMYSPLVSCKGFVVFHDIVETLPHCDCHSHLVWAELKQKHPHREFMELDDDLSVRLDNTHLSGPWGGLGVLLIGEPK